MPLHDVGYRRWPHVRSLTSGRWWILAVTGIALVWRSTWIKRSFVFTWLPAIVIGAMFAMYEQALNDPEMRVPLMGMLRASDVSPGIMNKIASDPVEARHTVWATLLLGFLRYPQTTVIVLLVGIIAPRLISYDIRNRGLLMLFSRPLRIADYILGKSIILWFYLVLVTTIPALLLYILGLLVSPDMWVVEYTWDLPLRVLLASAVLMIPTTLIALMFSSLTVESRYAAFAWFAMWAIGWATYALLTLVQFRAFGRRLREHPELAAKWEIVSPYHVLGRVQQWCFGLTPDYIDITPYIVVLSTVCIVACVVLYRRVAKVSQL